MTLGLIMLLSVWLINQYTSSRLEPVVAHLNSEMSNIKTQLRTWHDSGVDESVVPESLWLQRTVCSSRERQEFESRLSQLGTTMTQADLVELRAWFDRCGTVVARRDLTTALMIELYVDQLVRLSSYADRLIDDGIISVDQFVRADILSWQEWSRAWQHYAALQIELDELQRSLIEARYQGVAVEDQQIQSILDVVADTQATMNDQRTKKDEAFKALTKYES